MQLIVKSEKLLFSWPIFLFTRDWGWGSNVHWKSCKLRPELLRTMKSYTMLWCNTILALVWIFSFVIQKIWSYFCGDVIILMFYIWLMPFHAAARIFVSWFCKQSSQRKYSFWKNFIIDKKLDIFKDDSIQDFGHIILPFSNCF